MSEDAQPQDQHSNNESIWVRKEAIDCIAAQFTQMVRRSIRTQSRLRSLGYLIDLDDVEQSVWRSFIQCLLKRPMGFESEAQLVSFLNTLIRNKLSSLARKSLALKRDLRRTVTIDPKVLPAIGQSPFQRACESDFIQFISRQLTSEERQIATLRSSNHSWKEIAEILGTTPHIARKRLRRAVDRITLKCGSRRREQ